MSSDPTLNPTRSARDRGLGDEYQALDNYRLDRTTSSDELPPIQGVDFKLDIPDEPPSPVPGQPIDPANPFIGDQRFGHWESVIAPPYTGELPPPLARQYRPFPEGTPLKTGGTTGWYTPGRNWAADAPYVQYQEQYRFRISGREATAYTRMVHQNGRWQQERWIQNVYEYQKNTQMSFSGDVSVRGKDGDLAGLPSPPHIDYEWKPIGLNEIATLSSTAYGGDLLPSRWLRRALHVSGRCSAGGMSGLPCTAGHYETTLTRGKLLIAVGVALVVAVAVCVLLVISRRPSDCDTVRSMIAHNNQFNEHVETAASAAHRTGYRRVSGLGVENGPTLRSNPGSRIAEPAGNLANLAKEAGAAVEKFLADGGQVADQASAPPQYVQDASPNMPEYSTQRGDP